MDIYSNQKGVYWIMKEKPVAGEWMPFDETNHRRARKETCWIY